MTIFRHWLLSNRIPIILSVAHLALAVYYSAIIPIFEASDENNHFFFARNLALSGHIPNIRFEEGPWGQQATQGPLYYFTAAAPIALIDTRDAGALIAATNPLVNLGDGSRPGNKNAWLHNPDREAWPWRGAVLAVHAARWVSALYGAITVWFVYHMALHLNPRAASIAGAMAALLPQFIWGSGSATNDTAIAAAAAFVLWALVSPPLDWPIRNLVVLGVALGLAALAKTPGLMLSAYVIGAVAIRSLRLGWRTMAMRVVLVSLMFGAIAGPWLLMNWMRYGDPTALSAHLTAMSHGEVTFLSIGRLPSLFSPDLIRATPGYVLAAFVSLWGVFGLHNILAPAEVYSVFNWLTGLGFVGFGLSFVWPLAGERRERRGWQLWLSGWLVLHLTTLVYWAYRSGGGPGRLLFPALPVIVFACAVGWLRIADWLRVPPLSYALRGLFPALLGVFALAAPGWLIIPAYAPPPAVDSLPPTAMPLGVHYAALELVGVESQSRVRPGESLEVTFYWRLTRPATQEYIIFPRLLDGRLLAVAGTNSYPGWGSWPVSLWQAGRIYADRYVLPTAADADRPGVGRVILSVEVDHVSQPPTGRNGDQLDPLYPLAQVALPPFPLQVDVSSPLAVFGDAVVLVSAEYPVTATPGESLYTHLMWQVRQGGADWQRFIHLDDGNRNRPALFAQRDGTPANGYGPLWWQSGELVPDDSRLDLPIDLPQGIYALWVGFADSSGLRVPISGGDSADGRLYLGTISVR